MFAFEKLYATHLKEVGGVLYNQISLLTLTYHELKKN